MTMAMAEKTVVETAAAAAAYEGEPVAVAYEGVAAVSIFIR